jgi:hypothetical protein
VVSVVSLPAYKSLEFIQKRSEDGTLQLRLVTFWTSAISRLSNRNTTSEELNLLPYSDERWVDS